MCAAIVSACHWTPTTKPSPSMRLDRAVWRAFRRPAGRRRRWSTAWWWNEFTPSVRVRTMRCRRERGVDLDLVRGLGRRLGLPVARDVLVQRAAAGDVERLAPRQIARIGMLRISAMPHEAQLEGVQARLGRAELHVALVGAVGRRVQVRPARQADAVEALDQRREVVRADGRQDHRDRAGGVERAQIRHPQGHLGVRGLAVAARRREAAGPQFRGGDANEGAHAQIIGSAGDIPHPPFGPSFHNSDSPHGRVSKLLARCRANTSTRCTS